jgi:RimJ/RimL family protein N-acetyltransferase
MTNDTISKLIDNLNKKKTNNLIHLRQLSENVFFSKAWLNKPKPNDRITYNDYGYQMYFITTPDNKFIGAVLDMYNDLHWFIKPRYRKKGYLTDALRNTILYHLLFDRPYQRITIDINQSHFSESKNVAISLGFVKTPKQDKFASTIEFKLSKRKYSKLISTQGQNGILSEERFISIKREINYHTRSLQLLNDEIRMILGHSNQTSDMDRIIRLLQSQPRKVDDVWHTNLISKQII